MSRPLFSPARRSWILLCRATAILATTSLFVVGHAAEPDAVKQIEAAFGPAIQPLLKQYCFDCHSGEQIEADVDLSTFATIDDVRQNARVWQQVAEMLESGQMPPKDADQPADEERKRLQTWVREFLTSEATARAGDPGPVVLRRLNNVEYTFTVRDLTGVSELDPAREFPVDGAAGEGFTNTGQSLVMSPALVTKYLDAAKEIARHAVLLPDGMRFSPSVTPADWTNETLARIREFYRQYSDASGGDQVNLQGVVFETNDGGRLPVERYLAATLEARDALKQGDAAIAKIAHERGHSPKYLRQLWGALSAPAGDGPSQLLDDLRAKWSGAKPEDAHKLTEAIARWQKALWRFTSVGHIGKLNGPQAWMEPVDPIAARQEIRLKLPEAAPGQDVVIYLSAGDAGDGNEHDFVVWERPRLVAPGRPDLSLRDLGAVCQQLAVRREQIIGASAKCLTAAAEASDAKEPADVKALAAKHGVEEELLGAWLDYLGIAGKGPAKIGNLVTGRLESASGYDFVKGWTGNDALSVVANSSDQHVRIPGNLRGHSLAVHPAPTQSIAVGWRSPGAMTIDVGGAVQHAHPECGNGVAWSLELRRGNARQKLGAGISHGATPVAVGPASGIAVQEGDLIVLAINPRDGNHSCDLTAVDLNIRGGEREWDLARDVSPDILAANPHGDRYGNAAIWHFFSEPAAGGGEAAIPAGSLLAKWQTTASREEKQGLAEQLQTLLSRQPGELPKDSPDTALYHQIASVGGPLLSAALHELANKPAAAEGGESTFGLDPELFGRHPNDPAASVDAASLCVQAPSLVEVRLPADLVAGADFVTTGALDNATGQEGSVQLHVQTTRPSAVVGLEASATAETNAGGPWTSNNRGVSHATPVVVAEGSAARKRFEKAFADFRNLFPAALCYTKIVPVDEVVTLTLFYREDDQLQRLMLDDAQKAELDRLWDQLHFVSQDALKLVDAYAQLMEYATQDADPKVFEPLRKPIHDRAEAFKQLLVTSEPQHVDAVLAFAGKAFRRPLKESESRELRELYAQLRGEDFPHDEAVQLLLARVFVSPAFLYKLETPVDGGSQGPIDGAELATRLSYFLWSSCPDGELLSLAEQGRLQDPATLVAQTRRMLGDAKTRRLATEFACAWLHIHGFDQLDEKSERHFPTFGALRGAMYEEAIQFFTDLFQHDGSILSIVDADYAFLNEELAKHYEIPGVTGPQWRRVDGVKAHGRGGALALAAILAKQAGASRTSPILRGAWLSEVVLGEKLPRPPKGVPVLADEVPAGLTERQLTERHSTDAGCAKCHQRIDPFGFAMEGFDAIGRHRTRDAAGLAINTQVKLPDGTEVDGMAGLQKYLLTARRDAFVRQFTRKLLGYALGRSVQLSDEPLLAEIQTALAASDYRFAAAVERIVASRQFREIRGREVAQAE